MSKNVILGSGIAGLAAAWEAKKSGIDTTIYEARPSAGGLLDNLKIDGFTFDNAVHLSFAWEQEVRERFDRVPYHTHSPDALCRDNGVWLKHPVQNNLYPLSPEEKVELITGLVNAPSDEVRNYRDWLVHQYGEPIAARWPLVYTEKYWTLPAEALGIDWIGQRLRRADLGEVLYGAMTSDTPTHFYAKEMRYPEKGGYRGFIGSMIEGADIVYDHRVTEIRTTDKQIGFANGKVVDYEAAISTLPLPRLIEMMTDAPDDVRQDASTLFATEIDLISIGFNRPKVSPALWFYIYDRDIWASRAYSPDWKSKSNVPDGCSALQFEIYSSPKAPQTKSVEELKANTVAALEHMGLATQEDILFVHHKHIPYANVVFDQGMEQRRDRVLKWVREMGIQSCGRFGEWDYLWSNQSMMSGLKAARQAFGLPCEASS